MANTTAEDTATGSVGSMTEDTTMTVTDVTTAETLTAAAIKAMTNQGLKSWPGGER